MRRAKGNSLSSDPLSCAAESSGELSRALKIQIESIWTSWAGKRCSGHRELRRASRVLEPLTEVRRKHALGTIRRIKSFLNHYQPLCDRLTDETPPCQLRLLLRILVGDLDERASWDVKREGHLAFDVWARDREVRREGEKGQFLAELGAGLGFGLEAEGEAWIAYMSQNCYERDFLLLDKPGGRPIAALELDDLAIDGGASDVLLHEARRVSLRNVSVKHCKITRG